MDRVAQKVGDGAGYRDRPLSFQWRSALAIGFDSFVVGVRAGAEASTSPLLAFTVRPHL